MSKRLQYIGGLPVVYPTLGVGEVPDGELITVSDDTAAVLLKDKTRWQEPPAEKTDEKASDSVHTPEPDTPAKAASKKAAAAEEVSQ